MQLSSNHVHKTISQAVKNNNQSIKNEYVGILIVVDTNVPQNLIVFQIFLNNIT